MDERRRRKLGGCECTPPSCWRLKSHHRNSNHVMFWLDAPQTVMKAAPFEYFRVGAVDEACAMLAADENARVIAGGQTLVPMMVMRLARPTRLVDINRIAELSYIRSGGGVISIGATTRQCQVERDARIAAKLPLLARAISFVGHAATRARGTIGGSLANADPAAELPLIAITLDAILAYRAGGRTEKIAAHDFYIGPMTTSLPS